MSFKLKNTEAFLINYANKLIQLAKTQIDEPRQRTYSSGRVVNAPIDSSGELKQSLRLDTKAIRGGDFFQFNINGSDYGEKVDEGTKAGTSVSVNDLVSWINRKPVTLQSARGRKLKDTAKTKNRIANLIAQKIKREGIKPTNFLTQLVDEQFDNLLGVTPEVVKDISQNLDSFMKVLGYTKQGNTFKIQK